MSITLNQRNLSRGEITEKLGARVDLSAYQAGLATCRNFTVNPTSGVSNRSGTVFCDETRYPAKRCRLIPFVFNTSAANSYVIEFGDQYIEFLQGGNRVVLTSQNITGITKASVAVVTYSGSDTYANGDDVIITGVVGMVEVNNRRFRVANVSTGSNTFELTDTSGTNVNSTNYTTYSSGGIIEEVYSISSSYVEADLQGLYIAQSADVLQIRHQSYPPKTLTRTAATSWTLALHSYGPTNSYPTACAATAGTAGSRTERYRITATSQDWAESLPGVESGSKTMSAATKADPCAITTTAAHGYTSGEEVYITGVNGMTQLNGNRYIITVTGSDTFTLDGINSSSYSTWTSAGTIRRTQIVLLLAAVPSVAAPNVITWTAVSGARQYWIYKETQGSGLYGRIGISKGTTYKDTNVPQLPDDMDIPPTYADPFDSNDHGVGLSTTSTSDWPKGVTYAQQREINWNTVNHPDTIIGSRIADFNNFNSEDLFDDEAVTFSLAGNEVNEIQHVFPLGDKLLALTTGGEWALHGNEDGVITPFEPGAKQFSSNGSGTLKPIVIDGAAIYIQGRGSNVLGLGVDAIVDGYQGNKLSIFSEHLVKGYGLTDWALQKIPNSIVWIIRSDGTLLSVTLVKEHQIIGWARHDTDGTFENVVCVPEGSGATAEDAVYFVVKRSINGRTVRYIERLANREFSNAEDAVLADCSATYDGWNTGVVTMTITTATTYAAGQTLTVTASSGTFAAADVGNGVFFRADDDSIVRFTIVGYTNSTHVTGTANVLIPSELRNTAVTDWATAVDSLSGLGHLEGESVSVWADGWTYASPNNTAITTTVTVTGGAITLSRPFATITIGLPIVADLKTLDLDIPNQESLIGRAKLTNEVETYLESSRGLFIGSADPGDDSATGLEEVLPQNALSASTPGEFQTGPQERTILSEWSDRGRVFLRQIDPSPINVCAISPIFTVGG